MSEALAIREFPRAATRSVIRMERIRKVYNTGKVEVEALRGIDLQIGNGLTPYLQLLGRLRDQQGLQPVEIAIF